ncbi:uncharacterized protein LOC143235200 isoform X2 [Tachypleus tridentatus]|uniref:uncharacterized protein LOC143235200 isoform X2 n=1 Tax=Tachypleus tridentatus TaxID=6853 RepID=UPI003FD0ADF9
MILTCISYSNLIVHSLQILSGGLENRLSRDENPVPIPIHYFVVVTRCLVKGRTVELCFPTHLNVQAFILPHIFPDDICMNE